jgi:2-amino-4-hydroxy-6-hydroxymethyldihydropteridine diphosphokinase
VIPVAIALGSNMGNKAAHLDWAVSRLRTLVHSLEVSSYIDTKPVGVKDQPDFVNAVVVGHTDLPPRALLEALLALEAERGRERKGEGEPRQLDLDLILYGGMTIDEPGLTVPHPRYHERQFVLAPLAEIAPSWVDPASGKTIADLAAALQSRAE